MKVHEMSRINTYFKDRLNYLGTRMAELDLINIAYYINGYCEESKPLLITAQVGKSQHDMIMETGSMLSSFTRDYFIFTEDLPEDYLPKEGDVILDKAFEQFYCRVSTINSQTTFKATNETMVRLRIRTSVTRWGSLIIGVPDVVATWLRSDAVPVSRGVRPADWHPNYGDQQ